MVSCSLQRRLPWTLRILSGISEGIFNTMVQSGGEFLYIGVGGSTLYKVEHDGGVVAREVLTDRQWELLAPILPGKEGDPGRTGQNNRATVEGMLWVMRTGAPWRDLPADFGNWNSIHRRFRRWTDAGVWDQVLEAANEHLDLRAVMIDGSFAKVHQHGTGAPKEEARPRSRQRGKPLAVVAAGLLRKSWHWWTGRGDWSSSPSGRAKPPKTRK